MRARGLKLSQSQKNIIVELSRPMRARGLKQKTRPLYVPVIIVAPHAGAWIETYYPTQHREKGKVAPHAGAWIETSVA